LQDRSYGHFAYAQANVYNPDGLSLFSQNWRAQLAPSSRVENQTAVANDLVANADAVFWSLADILRQSGASVKMSVTNAH
jgi:hypothetical protein